MAKESFGSMLRTTLRERGLSQQEIADASRVSQSYVSLLARSQNARPSLQRARRIIKALGLPPYEQRRMLYASGGVLEDIKPCIPVLGNELNEEVRNLSTVWIIGCVSDEATKGCSAHMYGAMVDALSEERTNFVYWVSHRETKEFEKVRKRLESGLKRLSRDPGARLHRGLECIASPELISLAPKLVYDPFQETKAARQGVIDEDGSINGVIRIPSVDKIVAYLKKPYDVLRTEKKVVIRGEMYQTHYP